MATTTEAPPKQAAPPPPPATPAKPSSSTWPPPTTTSTTPAEAPASSSTPSAAVDAKHADRSAATADNKTDKKKAAAAAAVRGGSGSGLDPSSTRSLLIILHGKRVEDDLVRDAISSLKAEGHQISVRVTFDRGDVDAFVAEAIRLRDSGTSNYETIVAGGGDGTLNEVVAAMMAHRDAMHRLGMAVALLPLGTANDFACTAGISVDPLAALITALDPRCIQPIDVAAVNGKFFVNIAVAGSIAEVSPEELSSKWKRLLGPVAIGWHVLKRVVTPGSMEPHKQTAITFCTQPAGSAAAAQPPAETNTQQQQKISHKPESAASADDRDEPGSLSMLAWHATQSLTAGRVQAPAQLGSNAGQLQAPPLVDDDGPGSSSKVTSHDKGSGNGNGSSSSSSATKSLTADVLMLAVGNSRQMGRRVKVCPDALLDDGLLDFTLWTGESLTSEATALLGTLMGGGSGRSSVDRGIAQLKASWLLLEAPQGAGSIPVNRDGEPEEASTRLLFEVLPRVLPMHLPDARMLLSGRQQQQQQKRQEQPPQQQQQQQEPLQQQHSAESAVSSSSIQGNVYTEGEIKPAAAAAGASSHVAGEAKDSRRHRKLRKRTLQRMMFDISQPEGSEVRQRQQMVALTRKLCCWGGLLLLGGAAGWAHKARQERQQQREERQRDRERRQEKAGKSVQESGGGRRRRRGSFAVFA